MKLLTAYPLLILWLMFSGCQTNPEKVDWWDRTLGERDGLRPYHVKVEVSESGSRIEVNGAHVLTMTNNTGEIILWADANGTFRNDRATVVKAYPVKPNQFVQVLVFSSRMQRTYVPHAIYFDLSIQTVMPVERTEPKIK